MKRTLVLAAVLGAVPLASASAAPSGSYRGSCSQIRTNGPILNAVCKGGGGRLYETTIDTRRCRGAGVANDFGTLTCGNVQGTSRPFRGDDDDNDQSYGQRRQQGYGRGYGYQQPQPRGYGYRNDDDDTPPPPHRYRRYYTDPDD